MSSKRNENAFYGKLVKSKTSEFRGSKNPKTRNSKSVFSPSYFNEIDILPTHDRQDDINARNKRRQRKIWNPCNVSLILPGTYIFREFPFPRNRNDRYASNSVVWNYLRSHVLRIIYYRRLTSVSRQSA